MQLASQRRKSADRRAIDNLWVITRFRVIILLVSGQPLKSRAKEIGLFTRIDGTLLCYRLSGPAGAPELVLANSLGTDARIWDGVIERLSGSYRILSYDKRGHGLSDSPAGDYSLDDHLDDLLGLLDHVGMERPALAGVSVGGLIAQGSALRHPNRLAALILCASAPRF